LLDQFIAHAIEELRDRFQFTEREFGGIVICGRFEPDVRKARLFSSSASVFSASETVDLVERVEAVVEGYRVLYQ
jgi:hypothetical protein